MVHDRVSRVESALAALTVPTGGGVPLDIDGSGIASGCPGTYIQIFRFLIRRFWGVIGDAFVTVGARASARSAVVGHLTNAGEGSVSAVVDVVLGFPSKGDSHGLAYRRVARFNREVLGMNKMYLLEAQFVRPNGFRERKMDMVLDMVRALRDKEAEKGRHQGRAASEEIAGSSAHIVPRTGLPNHVLASRIALPIDRARCVPESGESEDVRDQDPIRVTNPLFSLSETGSSLASVNLDNNNPGDNLDVMDVAHFGFPVFDDTFYAAELPTEFSTESSLDAGELRLGDGDGDGDGDALSGRGLRRTGVAPIGGAPSSSLIDALHDRISSVRELLGDECALTIHENLHVVSRNTNNRQ